MIPPMVLWGDPGKMTGLAWLLAGGSIFQVDEYPFDEACFQIEQWCAYQGPLLTVGWEAYRPRRGVPQDDAHFALEVIGVFRYLSRKHHCTVLPEGQPHDPDAADRKILIALGWWTPGKKDAQSAAVHMYKYLHRTGNLPPRERAILSEAAHTI
jgi:hypothetical protein